MSKGIEDISNQFDVPKEKIKMMVDCGVISLSIPYYREVIIHYKSSGNLQTTANNFNISKERVWQIVHSVK